MIKRRKWLFLSLAIVLVFAFSPTVFAFSDIKGDPGEASIRALEEKGLVNGLDDGAFQPKGKMTFAQGVHLMVKSFGLNIDNIRFIKEPKASDYFTNVKDDSWYAKDFIVAQLNGLPVPKDVNPNASMTREQYANLLSSAMLKTGDYMFIQIYIEMNDADQVDKDMMHSIQILLVSKIAELDSKQNFRPKDEITRSEAAVMLNRALNFVRDQQTTPQKPEQPTPIEKVDVTEVKVSDQVNKVVLNWGEKPNAGYGITVESISFDETSQTATIHYKLHYPENGRMYAEVLTEAKAETYVSSGYKIVTEQTP